MIKKFVFLMSLTMIVTLILSGCSQSENKENPSYYSNQISQVRVDGQRLNTEEFEGRFKNLKEFWSLAGLNIMIDGDERVAEATYTFLKEKMIVEEKIRQHANSKGINIEEEDLRSIVGGLSISEEDKEKLYILRQIEVDLLKEHIFFDIINEVEVSQKEIEDFYEKNPDFFIDREKVEAQYILLYDREKAEEVLTKLKNGANFEDTAREYSQDESNSEYGGSLGIFELGSMFPNSAEFQDKVGNADIGEITDVIESNMGNTTIYKIVKVIDKIPENKIDLEEVSADIENYLIELKSYEKFENLMEELEEINTKR